MYLHLGNDVVIRKSGVIGIYDIDKTTVSVRTREFLTHFEKTGRLTYACFYLSDFNNHAA